VSKDPAFLFYPADFLVGTAFMTNEQVGKYIRLLCLQHQHGPLTPEHMLHICVSYDEDVYAKFPKNSDNKHVNNRLSTEKNRREKFCKSRKENKLSGLNKKLSTV
jgi:hypothetical protein